MGLMMELMEMGTSLGNSKTIELRDPSRWKDTTGIKEFLAATHTASREDLCKVGSSPVESAESSP